MTKLQIYKKENIELKGERIACLYYTKDQAQELAAFKNFKADYQRLTRLFGIQPPLIKIKLIYTRQEMDKYWGAKSDMVGMTDNHNPYLIYIFSPLVYARYSDFDYRRLLTHELAHTFVTKINTRCYYWINEGICEYACGEKYDNRIKKADWQWFKDNNALTNPTISWRESNRYDGYKIAYNLTKFIVKKYGNQEVFSLLKIRRIKKIDARQAMAEILGGDFDRFITAFEKSIKLI